MLHLKNVKKDGNRITADCYPEDSSVMAHISLLGQDKSTFSGSFSGGEFPGYMFHARRALYEMAVGKRKLKDCTIMWY